MKACSCLPCVVWWFIYHRAFASPAEDFNPSLPTGWVGSLGSGTLYQSFSVDGDLNDALGLFGSLRGLYVWQQIP